MPDRPITSQKDGLEDSLAGTGPRTAGNLSARGVGLVYQTSHGPLTALRDLSLEVGRGEFVSVLGPSGCGTSTLLRLVTGVMPTTSGTIDLAGVPVHGPRPDVGIVLPQPTLLPWRTVLHNVLAPIRARRRVTAKDRDKAMELLRLVGLAEFAEHYPHELSGGMQQRVGIARGLVHDPELLLMDEPFAALDAVTRETMLNDVQRIWMATGKSVLFFTRSIPEAVYLSDRVLVMGPRPGKVVEEIAIDLPRPRTVATMAHARFNDYAAHLRGIFRRFDETPRA